MGCPHLLKKRPAPKKNLVFFVKNSSIGLDRVKVLWYNVDISNKGITIGNEK